jgi:hypothetical protein
MKAGANWIGGGVGLAVGWGTLTPSLGNWRTE